ncbi:MAG: hypothetical protein JXR34_03985 [Bacteroidales bacterium]|nr:hypothetical protein [Bacteroidales bacterium]
MNEWFSELTTIEKIYWIAAIVSSVFFLIQMISVFALGDLDVQVAGDTDIDVEFDDGIPYQFFTLRNMVGFFTVFSWSGLACISANYSLTTTLLISFVCGLVMMAIMSTLFYFLSRMVSSGTMDFKNAVGKIATVYIPIQAKRGGMGKVQIEIQGSIHELDAMTDEDIDFATNTIVEVEKIISGNILLVKKSS